MNICYVNCVVTESQADLTIRSPVYIFSNVAGSVCARGWDAILVIRFHSQQLSSCPDPQQTDCSDTTIMSVYNEV